MSNPFIIRDVKYDNESGDSIYGDCVRLEDYRQLEKRFNTLENGLNVIRGLAPMSEVSKVAREALAAVDGSGQ